MFKTVLDLIGKFLSLMNSLFNRGQKRVEDIEVAQKKQDITEKAEKAAEKAASEDEAKKKQGIEEMKILISD